MPTEIQTEITQLLGRVEAGDDSARDQLLVAAYDELHAQAERLMQGERREHTLQPTALVHEAALRMLDAASLARIQNRKHFYWAMSRAMRQVLVDHARARGAQRRGGEYKRVPLDYALKQLEETGEVDLIALDDVLTRLDALNARMHNIVMLRFFGGLEVSEVAQQLDVSESTVKKDWQFARAWLKTQLAETD